METALVQSLMRTNATVCAEILTWSGRPALAAGNLIQVGDHVLNVAEACSGIRSLQTAFMMSLFLGEFHRLAVGRRIGLMLASFGIAFLVNLLRTLLLTVLTGRGTERGQRVTQRSANGEREEGDEENEAAAHVHSKCTR